MNININGLNLDVKIWDTAGQEVYMSITKNFFQNTDGALIVFDLSNFETIKSIRKWLDHLNESLENCCKVIIGNKSDMKSNDLNLEQVKEELRKICDPENIIFFETSAKNGANVDIAFESLLFQIAHKKKEKIVQNSGSEFTIEFRSKVLKKQEENSCSC